MATKRAGKGDQNGELSGVQEMKGTKSSEHDAKRKHREIQKQQTTKEMKQRADTMRWIVIVVVFIIAAVGLYYYFSYASSGLPAAKVKSATKQGATKKAATKKAEGVTKKAEGVTKKAGKEKRTESKGSPPKKGKEPATSSTSNKQTTPKKSTKSDASSRNPPPTEGKKKTKPHASPETDAKQGKAPDDSIDSRVLRRPYKPDDPDRPHLVDLLSGDNLLLEGKYTLAMEKFNEVLKHFPQSTRAMYGKGVALRHMAREKRSNKLLDTAVDFLYKAGMEAFMGSEDVRIEALKELADAAHERGKTQLAIRALEKVVEYKKDDVDAANQLGMGYLAVGNRKKAKAHFKKVLEQFKGDHFAKAQLGFILFSEKKYEEALPLLLEGIREDEIIKMNPKFYLYAGDTLTRLNRSDEAMALYGEAVSLELFPSVWQRSLVNEPGLRATPWWSLDKLKYAAEIQRIEKAIKTITQEATAIFVKESSTFKTKGSPGSPHYVLFEKGKKNAANCESTPKTCALIETFPEAASCKRGTVKFSALPPRTHIYPFVEVTNTVLQVTVGLVVDKGVRIRMADDTKILQEGQIAIVDESFEQELWYMGSEPAIFLTVDMWHPDISQDRIKKLGPLS